VAPEVSFAVYGERGWIDLLCWHAETQILLVVELKTEIADIQELIGVVDRKARLAKQIGRARGWNPRAVAVWVVVAEGATNRRRVATHDALLRAAFPADGAELREWLRRPSGRVVALSFFSYDSGAGTRRSFVTRKRVRRVMAARPERDAGAPPP
jgi:hypothetical protein